MPIKENTWEEPGENKGRIAKAKKKERNRGHGFVKREGRVEEGVL